MKLATTKLMMKNEDLDVDLASWEYWKNGVLVASGDLCDHPCDEYLKGESCKCNDLSLMLEKLKCSNPS